MNRREFLCASVGAVCVLAALPAVAEPIPQLRVALIGCGSRGRALAEMAIQAGGCQVTATFDADPALARAAAARYGATSYASLRELLASAAPEIAIISGRLEVDRILQPLRAGTHLFLDRMPTAAVAEEVALRKAAKSSGKVVQVNLGGSSLADCPKAAKLLRSGSIGRVSTVRAHVHYYYPTTPHIGQAHLLSWAGELPALSGEGALCRVTATGHGRHQVITWEFERLTAIWEQRVFTSATAEQVSSGATWYGSAGVLRLDGDSWRLDRHDDAHQEFGTISRQDRDTACWSEFIRAVQELRQPSRSLETALSAAEMVRLAECSRKLQRPLEWDNQRRVVVRDAEANRLLHSAPEWMA